MLMMNQSFLSFRLFIIKWVFLIMQTGSGKTYTMLGEIENLEVKPSPHRGMTPRIFEFLFARIQAVSLAILVRFTLYMRMG